MKRHRWNISMVMITITLALLYISASETGPKKNPCKNPEHVKILMEQIRDFYGKSDFRSALRAAMDAKVCKADDPEVEYWLGLCYYRLEKSDDALSHLKAAQKLQQANTPEIAETQMAIGMIYLDQQKWDDAIQMFSTVVDNLFFPRNYEAFNNLGWAYFKKGELDKAEENFNTAIKHYKSFCQAYSNLGELYAKQGGKKPAVQTLQKAIELCPNYVRPHFLLGLEYNRKNAPGMACTEFRKTIQLAPDSDEAGKSKEYLRFLNCPPAPAPEPASPKPGQ